MKRKIYLSEPLIKSLSSASIAERGKKLQLFTLQTPAETDFRSDAYKLPSQGNYFLRAMAKIKSKVVVFWFVVLIFQIFKRKG